MSAIRTDLAVKYPWYIAKNGHNTFTITFTNGGSAFDITNYTFSLVIRRIGKAAAELTLTQGSGLTNGTTTGILTIDLTKAQSEALNGSYFYELLYTINSKQYRALEGTLGVVDQYNPDGSSATSLTAQISLAGTNINASISLGNGIDQDTVDELQAQIAALNALFIPVNSAVPVISGTLQNGQTLSTTNGTWSNTPTSYTYQWYRNAVAISGATNSTLLLGESDEGTTITVSVIATNTFGTSSAATSTGVVIQDDPVNTVPVSIAGTATVGSLLTATPGTWTQSPTLTYQWLRDDVAIAGETGTTYTIVEADVDAGISVQETATNSAGTVSVESNVIVGEDNTPSFDFSEQTNSQYISVI